MCSDFPCKPSLQNFSLCKEFSDIFSQRYLRLHVKYPLFASDFYEPRFSGQIFEKYTNIKFYENQSSES